jgi:hypothetical protein
MSYSYSPKQLLKWPREAAASALWQQLQHQKDQTEYWRYRCMSAERRMQAHDCQEEQ